MLTADRKNCLPSSEKSAYRKQKKLLTADGKNSLPNDGKIILPRTDIVLEKSSIEIEYMHGSALLLLHNEFFDNEVEQSIGGLT